MRAARRCPDAPELFARRQHAVRAIRRIRCEAWRVRREVATRSAIVLALLRYLASAGADPAPLVARFGSRRDAAAELDEISVLPSVIAELLDASAYVLAEPAAALRLPAVLLRVATRSPSSPCAPARRCATRHAPATVQAVHPQLVAELGGDRWLVRTPDHPRGISRHVHELALAYARHLTGAVVTRVWFAHSRPRDVDAIVRWAGTADLEFGADSGFAIANLDRGRSRPPTRGCSRP